MNCELPDVQAGFRRGRRTRDQIANICWITEKAREFQKNIYFCFIDYAKAFDCVDHNKLWKILKEMGIPDHLTCLLRNRYTGQEATVRIGHETTDWFQIGKGGCQGYILSPCLFNLYAGYIMRNAGLDEAQAGIKISGRNINNLRYTDDTTLMEESTLHLPPRVIPYLLNRYSPTGYQYTMERAVFSQTLGTAASKSCCLEKIPGQIETVTDFL